MKLILCLSLIWKLLSTAGALQCLNCTDSQCSSTTEETCTSEAACVTASIQVSIAQTTNQQPVKACAEANVCPAIGSSTLSMSTSGLSAVVASQCCSSDNCNSATPTLPTQAANGLKCFTCDFINGDCSKTIQCKGPENRCFRSKVTIGATTGLTLGCASANLCSEGSGLVLSGANLTCCGSSLCNSAAAPAATSLLLGLLVFSLY